MHTARIQHTILRQMGTGIVDPEQFYGAEERRASVGLTDVPYSPVASGTPLLMSPLDLVRTSGPQFPLGCVCGLCGGPEVPQRSYIPAQMSPALGQRNGETLTFSKGGCGVHLVDALRNHLSGLIGGDDLMFVDAPVATFSLRILVRD
jgi:hypothetical protein